MDFEMLTRLLLACLWGGLVGLEREYRGKAAGFRTTILISLGSCFFTMMSMVIGSPESSDRIASNIVTGLGFLSAGVIFRADNHVNGITTAATIWAVAAVGMGIGAGYYTSSAFAGTLILVILILLPKIQDRVSVKSQYKILTISFNGPMETAQLCENLMKLHNVKYKLYSQNKENGKITVKWELNSAKSQIEAFAQFVFSEPKFDSVEMV
jgi:putative Mg2+ transporter-C (MgtC) family protein